MSPNPSHRHRAQVSKPLPHSITHLQHALYIHLLKMTVLQAARAIGPNISNIEKVTPDPSPIPSPQITISGHEVFPESKTRFATEPYTILEEPNRTGRKIKVIAIGAGASSINLAHDIDIHPLDIDFVAYEKNPEIGGTWYENRYPGVACDIPSVVYQLSWAPAPPAS